MRLPGPGVRICAVLLSLGLLPAPAGAAGWFESFAERAAELLVKEDGGRSRIFLPLVSTEPNLGTTAGLLPVWLWSDERKQIRHMLVPSADYNGIYG